MDHILIIEDEKPLSRLLELELGHAGYGTETAFDGRTGLELALAGEYACILLDLMLPGLSGMEVCRRIRQVKGTPIVMLTARSSVFDKVNGLDCGADDYVAKPFDMEELLARLRAVGRRNGQAAQALLRAGELTLHAESRLVKQGGRTVELSVREFDLLHCLMRNQNRVLTRDLLLNQVWGTEFDGGTNVVDVYIRYLRAKLEDGGRPKLIHTVRGVGYSLREPEEEGA